MPIPPNCSLAPDILFTPESHIEATEFRTHWQLNDTKMAQKALPVCLTLRIDLQPKTSCMMNKTLIYIALILTLTVFECHAQVLSKKVQAQETKILASFTDSCQLLEEYYNLSDSLVRSRAYSETIRLIQRVPFHLDNSCKAKLNLTLIKAKAYSRNNTPDSAILTLHEALAIELPDSTKGYVYHLLGTTQLNARQSTFGNVSLRKAVKYINQSSKNIKLLIIVYNNYANTFGSLSQFDSAIYYFKKSLDLNHGKYLNLSSKAASLSEMGRTYFQLDILDSANSYYTRALELGDTNFSYFGYVAVYSTFATVKFRLGEYDLSKEYFKKAEERLLKIPRMDTNPYIYRYLSALEARDNNVEAANEYIGKADTLYLE